MPVTAAAATGGEAARTGAGTASAPGAAWPGSEAGAPGGPGRLARLANAAVTRDAAVLVRPDRPPRQ